ncbi:transposase [Bernardetia sp. MNP-M8]|uniref:transposase n=1 Tax=Bernardetia sp. MNP-M8 TaxID=3127470 RepID=UPI0030D0AB6C
MENEDEELFEHIYPNFFTATILKWLPLLKPDKYKQLIINSLDFLVTQKRAKVYAFVIMPNHIHLIWKILTPYRLSNVKRDFFKFLSNKIKKDLKEFHPDVLPRFESTQNDRKYHFWQRNPLPVFLYSREVLEQKLDYIHHNPVTGKWMLVNSLEQYKWSSFNFYEEETNDFIFLSHYMEEYE